MATGDGVILTAGQWRFLTQVLGWVLPERFVPAALSVDEIASIDRVNAVSGLADDQNALGTMAAAFDAGIDDAAYLKAASAKLGAVAASIANVGRRKPSTMSDPDWNKHVKEVRGTAADTRGMWAKIANKLKDNTLDKALRDELEAMQNALAATLMEVLDIETAHGPTNHVKITQDGAGKRALIGVSPRDGQVKDKAKNATKFSAPNDFIQALDFARKSPELANKITSVTDLTDPSNPVITQDYIKISLKLEDVFGANYADHVEGQTMVGSGQDRTALTNAMKPPLNDAAADLLLNGNMGVAPTDLTDGTITCGFMYIDGVWELSTMHPEVAKIGTQPANPRPANPDLKYDRANDQWLKQDPLDGSNWKPYDPDKGTWKTP